MVSRRVRSGSVTAYLNRSASSGLDFLTSGCVPSALRQQAHRAQLAVDEGADVGLGTVRPKRSLTRSATSA